MHGQGDSQVGDIILNVEIFHIDSQRAKQMVGDKPKVEDPMVLLTEARAAVENKRAVVSRLPTIKTKAGVAAFSETKEARIGLECVFEPKSDVVSINAAFNADGQQLIASAEKVASGHSLFLGTYPSSKKGMTAVVFLNCVVKRP